MNVPLRTLDPATWALLTRLAAGCYCREHAGQDCPGGDCDGCLRCPSGRARAIISLETPRLDDAVALARVHRLLSGRRWDGAADLLEAIAEVIQSTGRPIAPAGGNAKRWDAS